jgi:GNAT superfamily N-acetyltransferase
MDSAYEVRAARAGDIASLAAIERDAAAQFRKLGFDGAFLDETADPADLAEAVRDARLWVAEHDGACVGFAIACVLGDGEAWLEEIDVHPDHGRRGIGRALVRAVEEWARRIGSPTLGLTTFRDVPWNAPFYAKLGFRELPPGRCSPAIREILADESARGLPADKRLAMRLDLSK